MTIKEKQLDCDATNRLYHGISNVNNLAIIEILF